jgi:predicted transcriptional regulator
MRALYGISDEKRAEKLRTLLNAKSTDIQKSLQNLLNLLSKRKMVIIFNKSLESAGKIIVLPL